MSNLTFKPPRILPDGDTRFPPFYYKASPSTAPTFRYSSNYPRVIPRNGNFYFPMPKAAYDIRGTITATFNAADSTLSVTIPGHGKEILLARHNAGHFNNAPLWKSHAGLVRHLAGLPGNTGLAVGGQWHLTALRNDCIHSIIQAIYDGLSGQEIFLAIQNDSSIDIGELAHDAAECYFPLAEDGTVSRHSDHASNEAAETHYRALCARVAADKDADAPKLKHNMTVAQFKEAFPAPPPPAAPIPDPSVSLRAFSANYRTGSVVTAIVTRVRDALGGNIHWQLQQPGRLGWADLQTDANPPVAITGETFTPTAEGRYRAEIRGVLDGRGMAVANALSDEFFITTA